MRDVILIFLHTIIYAAPFDGLIFYFFRKRLRFSWRLIGMGYLLLLGMDFGLRLWWGESELWVPFLMRGVTFCYAVSMVKDSFLRVLSLALLTIPPTLFAYSAGTAVAHVMGNTNPFNLWRMGTILAIYLSILPLALKRMKGLLPPLLEIDDVRLWICLAGYEGILTFFAIWIDPFNHSFQPRILAARFLMPPALFQCLRVIDCIGRYAGESLSLAQQEARARKLRSMEAERYHTTLTVWKNSRRLRHDLKHHLLYILRLAKERDREALHDYLQSLANALKKAGGAV